MKNSSNCQTWVNWNWQECYVKNSQRSFAFEIGFLCVAAPMSPKNVTQDVTLKLLTRSDFFVSLQPYFKVEYPCLAVCER